MKVGDYVRFKDKRGNTYIRKVIDGYKAHWYGCKVDKEANNVPYVSAKNTIKSSPNIIDLIEVGDYVNGIRVHEIEKEEDGTMIKIGNLTQFIIKDKEDLKHTGGIDGNNDRVFPVKSIVTHEQFSQMEYRIGE